MSTESFTLDPEDSIVRRFISGLEAWERPFEPTSVVRTRGAIRRREPVRTRGAPVRTGRIPSYALEDEDRTMQNFRQGLETWEHPFGKSSQE